ncbi:beta-ketoacyl-ACP synthase 3 [Streptomyces puniciscabiei]|uniref:beta-ketoacyl-ACP synthase 3 n=1 Tax=Streptomyces puniciscabiei TaxID=164348 RepID=UPI00378FDCFE
MDAAVLAGLGGCLPGRAIGNAEIAAALSTTDEWIRTRTGIHERHRAAPGTGTGELAAAAGRAALTSAQEASADLLIVATVTPDQRCPATAPQTAARLGLGVIPAYDINAVCSGFLYALAAGRAAILAHQADRVLVIGADTMSTVLDDQDRDTAVIFGDGAGAVLLRRGRPDEPGALAAVELGSDGDNARLAEIAAGGSRLPDRDRQLPYGQHRLRMDGRTMFAHAVRRMAVSCESVLDRTGWTTDSLDAFIGHQANQRILDALAARLGIPAQRCHGNIRTVGNTAAASVPLAMVDAALGQDVPRGSRTLLTAFGSGLTWGSATLTWPDCRVTDPRPTA